jgi:tetratricopeptide (TPR) repeat protein
MRRDAAGIWYCTMAASPRLLLVGWDGAEWNLIAPLLDAGKLPNLAKLVEAGVLAKLGSLSPAISASLWTSAATGRRPEDHGICGNVEPAGEGCAPISARWRQGSTLWQIVARAGRPAVVVDWPASMPASETTGLVIVSGTSVTPARLAADVAELRVTPSELSRDDLRPFVSGIEKLEPSREPWLAALMTCLAESAGTQAVATYVLENEPWDLAMVNYGALGRIHREFLDFISPRLPQVSDEMFARCGGIIEQALILHDQALGRLLAVAGSDCAVLLCSCHGWMTGSRRPELQPGEHAFNLARAREQGWAVLRTPEAKADELLFGGSILDIAPTVLWLLGLPVPRDWPGRVWYHALTKPTDAVAIATHEPGPLAPPAFPEPATEIARELRHVYGVYLFHGGRLAEAIRVLEEAHRAMPTRIGPGLSLINAYVVSRRFAEARALLEELEARPEGGLRPRPGMKARHPPQFDFMRGLIAHGEGRLAEARTNFEAALAAESQTADLHANLGRVLLGLRCKREARTAFERGLQIDPDSVPARYGLALACYQLRDFAAAADHAMEAASRRTEPPEFHLLLGLAFARIGQREQAVVALRNSLVRNRWLLLAHRVLVVLHRRNPAESVLVETHRQAVREIRSRRPAAG